MRINKRQLKEMVKQALCTREGVEIAPAPVKPATPRTKPKEAPFVRPNPLAPPKEAPKTNPKGLVREEEKEVLKKITSRFAKLKRKN